MSLMKKNKRNLVLVKKDNEVVIDSFSTKELAEEELQYRKSLCIAMGYTPDTPYDIRKAI